jgi:hypothetical protein
MWWHPLVVLLAWLKLYHKVPTLYELIAIVLHDIGYWGCPDMDGECGLLHPTVGARWTVKVVRGLSFFLRPLGFKEPDSWELQQMCWFHSKAFAREMGAKPSKLCGPDKLSIIFEPWWFYSLRARLSGELDEYVNNGPPGLTPRQWFEWLKERHRECYRYCKKNQENQDPQPDL